VDWPPYFGLFPYNIKQIWSCRGTGNFRRIRASRRRSPIFFRESRYRSAVVFCRIETVSVPPSSSPCWTCFPPQRAPGQGRHVLCPCETTLFSFGPFPIIFGRSLSTRGSRNYHMTAKIDFSFHRSPAIRISGDSPVLGPRRVQRSALRLLVMRGPRRRDQGARLGGAVTPRMCSPAPQKTFHPTGTPPTSISDRQPILPSRNI